MIAMAGKKWQATQPQIKMSQLQQNDCKYVQKDY
jgi:hypothetical protein